MEQQRVTAEVLAEKYCKGTEKTVGDVRDRVAVSLAKVERPDARQAWSDVFLDAQDSGVVMAGRINATAGTDLKATLINCFVQPLSDSVSDDVGGVPSIYKALQQAAETLRRGGGVGYDFSPLRPRGAWVKGTNSRSSGPIPYMHVFNTSCATIESAGARRGAQMGALRIDHPDVEEFIHSKDGGDLTYFNISVGVTDDFMQRVQDDRSFELVHRAQPHPSYRFGGQEPYRREDGMWVYKVVRARELWDQIMHATYDHAEPGILFLDQVNRENNLAYCEKLCVTNPCGEQPLPPYGCCDLGSMNLTRYVNSPFQLAATFDWARFKRDVATAVRMLDNVLDVTPWPLEEQEAEAMAKRRVGLGFLGLGDALVMMGLRYDREEGRSFAARVSETMRDAAYWASVGLAKERGAFPAFDADAYLSSGFCQRLPQDLRHAIKEYGIRNSHLLSIAPTGTITLAFADNASNGIEPAFAWSYERRKRRDDLGWDTYQVEDHAFRLYKQAHGLHGNNAEIAKLLPPVFVSAQEMSATDHMMMMEAVQPFVDTAISKTVNVPADYPFEQFEGIYTAAWQAGLKGIATYRPNATLGAVLSVDGKDAMPGSGALSTAEDVATKTMREEYESSGAFVLEQGDAHLTKAPPADCDPLMVRVDKRPLGDLEGITRKFEYTTGEGTKRAYVMVNFAVVQGVKDGRVCHRERPVEFFMPAGQADSTQWTAAVMRLLSLVARQGGSVAKALENLREVVWDKGPVRCGTVKRADGAVVPRYHDSEVAALGYELQQLLVARGFLNEDGTVSDQAELQKAMQSLNVAFAAETDRSPIPAVVGNGRKCPECGAHALHKVDGCEHCSNCGYVGTCG